MLSSGKLILLFVTVYSLYSLFLYLTNRKRLLIKSFLTVFFCLFLFGLYSLYSIIRGICQFNNSPDAYNQLQEELKKAESDLKKLGFPFNEFDIKLNRYNN